MHAVVMDSLEEYLAGSLEPAKLRAIEAHLNGCGSCREQVRSMEETSAWFGSLRCAEEAPATSPGFYAAILQKVDEQRAAEPSFASLFSLDLAFGRRLVFASLLTLAVLGGYLVSHEAAYPASVSPEAVMAQQDFPAFDAAPAQANMLVTLTAYEH
jgi:anti-sigma factor RsiW